MGVYRLGLVCLNGHAINSCADKIPEKNEAFCSQCGTETISTCPECRAPIRGYYEVPNVFTIGTWQPKNFCHKCGKPYPWTKRKTEALQAVIDELEELSTEEKQKLQVSIPDIINDTAASDTAVIRFKKAVTKVGSVGAKVLSDVLVKVASEAVKKSLGL